MYKNIFYFRSINKIGGTEQFLYELAKKYHNLDITIFYDKIDKFQLRRLSKLIRCKKRVPGEKVECKKAFYNFTIDMIDDVEAKDHIFVSHAIYQIIGETPPITHPKLTKFIGVSDYACNMLEEIAKELGINIKTQRFYDPFTMEKVNKPKIIVSACRLDDKVKGGERTLKLAKALDNYCDANNEHYMWFIFTNPINFNIESNNIIVRPPTIDIKPYLAMADYVAQLSDDMETFCYTINESLSYSVPVITTPLSINKELSITDNENIILNWDCSNADQVAKEIFTKKVKPFKYKPPEDDWKKILAKGKSTYKCNNKMYKVKALEQFTIKDDFKYIKHLVRADKNNKDYGEIYTDDIFECNEDLKNMLSGDNYLNRKSIEVINEI